jgi:methionine-rich copper-binding protein CopC
VLRRLTIFLLLVAGCALGTAAPALADATVLESSPAAGASVLADIAQVSISFEQVVTTEASSVVVRGADGTDYSQGPAWVELDHNVWQDVRRLPPGAYRVSWATGVITSDLTRGEFTFTVSSASVVATAPDVKAASTPGYQPGGTNEWIAIWLIGLVPVALVVWRVVKRQKRVFDLPPYDPDKF